MKIQMTGCVMHLDVYEIKVYAALLNCYDSEDKCDELLTSN